MKFILDMKDFCKKAPHTDEKDYNELFYRYNICEDNSEVFAVVWFSQMVDSGNIYTVSVAIKNKELKEYFDIYVVDEGNNDIYFYPTNYELNVKSARLNGDNFNRFQAALRVGRDIADTIMKIFQTEEHISLRKEK